MTSIDILAKKADDFASMRIVFDLGLKTERTYYIPLFFGRDYLVRAACILSELDIIDSINVSLNRQFSARGVIFRHGIMDTTKYDAILWGQPNKC